jgi:SAM-dependent methyltransferase
MSDQMIDDLVPPVSMMFDGASSEEEFRSVGDGFTRHFLIEHAKLMPDEKVLDLGCGIGQKARTLTRYINQQGSYEGLDIVPAGISWCKEKYREYTNYNFQLADIYSEHYNKRGAFKASEYIFPYEDATFDLVFLSSLFTHMLPRDMENYLSEITRVLKQSGRSIVTYFLLNPVSLRNIDADLNTIKIPFEYGSERCRVANVDIPETTVAHDEVFVKHLYEKNGLSITEITYGSWCGRKEFLGCLQDAIIAIK